MKKNFSFLLLLFAVFLTIGSTASAQSTSNLTQMLATHDGDQNSVAALAEGNVTLVSFWAMWCAPCKKEMKAMFPIYLKLKDTMGLNVEYIAVSIDDTKTMARVAPYINAKGYTFPVLLDPSKELFNMLNGTDVPFALLFASDGTLSTKHEGFLEGDEETLEEEIMALVNAANGQTGDVGDAGAETDQSSN
jgi:thiol-disulfide isomerase/thioredoxin